DAGHPDVHEHDVGLVLARQRDRPLAVVCLSDNDDVGLRVEQRAEARAHERLIVGEDDRDHRAGTGRCATTRKPPPSRGPAPTLPPSAAARSRMPAMPLPSTASSAPPTPSSTTSTHKSSSRPPRATRTSTEWACACRVTLVSASCTIRYAASST